MCGGDDGDGICLFSDGVVETSPGHFVAVFGYDNPAANSVHGVFALGSSRSQVDAGGDFTTINNVPHQGIARFRR